MEIWNKEADYSVRSIDEKYKVNVEYWCFFEQKGVQIEVKDRDDNILHFFSIELEKKKNIRLDIEG